MLKQRLKQISRGRATVMVLLLVAACAAFTGLVSPETHGELQHRYGATQTVAESGPGFFIFMGVLLFVLVVAGVLAQVKRKAAWKDYRDRQAESVYGRGKGLS